MMDGMDAARTSNSPDERGLMGVATEVRPNERAAKTERMAEPSIIGECERV